MVKISIADSMFMQYANTAKLGGGNSDITPLNFEWVLSDPQTARFVTDSHLKDADGRGQIAMLLETFFLHPEDYLAALQKPFDAVLTHNAYFAKHKGWLWYPHGGSFVSFKDWNVYEKTKNVSILLSPKKQLWGHRMFHEVVDAYGDRMDVFGLNGYARKMEAIAPYRYTVVIEAEETLSFFSEKLIDCLAVGTIPIYWGCPNIGDFFDHNGILSVQNIREIGDIVQKVSSDFYDSRLEAIKTNFQLAREYAVPEDWIFKKYPHLFKESRS